MSTTSVPSPFVSYKINSVVPVTFEFPSNIQVFRDTPSERSRWEDFNAESLPQYFTDGIRALRAHIDKLEDLSRPRKVEEDANLWFMIESLVQARHLLDDMHPHTDSPKGSS